MSLFSKQPIYCCVCGKHHETELGFGEQKHARITCSKPCKIELDRRATMSVMGVEYREKI